MSPIPAVRANAFTKLTLALHVLGTRPDGFHEIEALTVSVAAPVDHLEIAPASAPGITCVLHGPHAAGVPTDDTNLAVRAVRLAFAAAGVDARCALSLHKGIASGAGLGGGSADAAAALLGVRACFGLLLDDDSLAELGRELGSDVPFCLTGGAAWMRGRGERIEPIGGGLGPDLGIVVAVPPFRCSTPAVYRAWDDLGGATHARRVPAPAGVAAQLAELHNDLEPAAFVVQPALHGFRAEVEEATGHTALLAGSGAAYAIVCDRRAEAEAAGAALRHAGIEAHVGAVVPTGVAMGV